MFAKINNLNVRKKMLLGYLAPAAIYLGFPVVVIATTTQVLKTFQETERVQHVLGETTNISLGAEQMIRGLRGYLINKNNDFLTDFHTGAELALQSADNVAPTVKDPEQRIRLQRMRGLVKQYYEGCNEDIVRLVLQNQTATAIAVFNTDKYKNLVNEFLKVNQEFRETELSLVNQKTKITKEALSFLVLTLVVGSVLLVLFGAGIAWLISSGIVATIDRAIS